MATTWTIEIDWERTGNFNGTYDDVTDRIMDANWFLGFRKPYEDVDNDSVLNLVLSNSDKRYSPENTGSPLSAYLAPFRPVRVQSNDGTTERVHWSGWLESVTPTTNQYGDRVANIKATGPERFFANVETSIEIQEALTAKMTGHNPKFED
jgi:hypothetical protein